MLSIVARRVATPAVARSGELVMSLRLASCSCCCSCQAERSMRYRTVTTMKRQRHRQRTTDGLLVGIGISYEMMDEWQLILCCCFNLNKYLISFLTSSSPVLYDL
jgi:hypothetical protein